MSDSHIPPQSSFFYMGKWTSEMDSVFLSVLLHHKQTCGWETHEIPTRALHVAEHEMQRQFGVNLCLDELVDRKIELETRYWTFKNIIRTSGLYWDIHERSLTASEKSWNQIFETIEGARAYYYNDEPEFQKLSMLFGYEHVKVEKERSVIVLSDTIEPHNCPENFNLAQDNEEVTSPSLTMIRRQRRLLISSEGNPLDLESTNNIATPLFVDLTSESTSNPTKNAFPPRTKEVAAKGKATSSCASSNSKKWWPFK